MCERIHRPDIWTQRSDQNAARPLARRGPSTYGSRPRNTAGKASLPLTDITEFETGRTPPANNLAAIRKALESAGVIFIDEDDDGGPGVRLHKTYVQKRQGEWSPKGRNGTPTGVRV